MKTIIFLSMNLLLILQSCSKNPDYEKLKKEILILHESQKKAHFEKNAALLVKHNALDYTEINKGQIKNPTKEENIKKFDSYFNAVDFIKWDDVTPPIFKFSDDGTMATTVVNKMVVTKQKIENNKIDTTFYSWLSVYKKENNQWKLQSIISTNK